MNYTLKTTCHGMPNQIEGITEDLRPIYFRARHGDWYLSVGEIKERLEDIVLIPGNFLFLEGSDENAGWWDTDEAMLFCKKLLNTNL